VDIQGINEQQLGWSRERRYEW